MARTNLTSISSVESRQNKGDPNINYHYRGAKISFVSWSIEPDFSSQQNSLGLSLNRYDFVAIQGATKKFNEDYLGKTLNSYFAPAFLYEKMKVGSSLHSRYQANATSLLVSKNRAPFIQTPVTTLIADYANLRVINADSHRYISFEKWTENILQIFKEALPSSSFTILTGDFSVTNQDRKDFLFKEAKKRGLLRVDFPDEKRCKHQGHVHNFIFAKGLRLRSAEAFPINSAKHTALEIVLEPILN
jgi:hypothetical protein